MHILQDELKGFFNENTMSHFKFYKHARFVLSQFFFFILIISCSVPQQVSKHARKNLLKDPSLSNAHIGISIYDVGLNKYIYNHQADKYFIPASNTKIATCYVGLKYLGDSITSIRYAENDTAVFLLPSGDPTFLHRDFTNQPVVAFLKKQQKKIYITDAYWQSQALGNGWSWNDYNAGYMVERSALPVYGNVLRWIQINEKDTIQKDGFDQSAFVFSEPEINWPVNFSDDTSKKSFYVQRRHNENVYEITQGIETYKTRDVPFVTNGIQSALELLKDTIRKEIFYKKQFQITNPKSQTIKSQPIDSLLKPMMHRSDNFFAEQVLLMASDQAMGIMNEEKIIDSILKKSLSDLPQKPRWVDGSGLSRYNLFTPQSFVVLLNKMQQEFGMNRLKTIFPTGGQGTLNNFYKQDSGFVYGKTGTLSGVVAFSGYLISKKNKHYIFSVLVNNHQSNAVAIRKQVESFLSRIRSKY